MKTPEQKYLKRAEKTNKAFMKSQAKQKTRVKARNIKPGQFKKPASNYVKNRCREILKAHTGSESVLKTSDELWGEGYHPFYTDSARTRYIKSCVKYALFFLKRK